MTCTRINREYQDRLLMSALDVGVGSAGMPAVHLLSLVCAIKQSHP